MNDRGTMKWTSLMLPEHIALLNDMWEEGKHQENPILDEQKLMEINSQLQRAIHNDLTIEVKHNAGRDYLTKKGKLHKVDNVSLQLDDHTEIKLDNVLDVYID
ncbi:hypothetical protein J2Z83_001220 [Virgibacillus natechei]|uniref:YolD-like family protein n=1 Tax=Virgibacillus natechei TaxID=1216297 RepID=A0ABS4IDU6_9BACI|nr:YolD-like family protein [Virgibacillus natechei]MBP1969117.1 hypothetical protein [Virgibacillus natechei]UZD14383.1 YolD-like family protein [Virgibacillus natechei]